MEFLLAGMGIIVILNIFKTFMYIRSLDRRRIRRTEELIKSIVMGLEIQLRQERKENQMLSDVLVILTKED